MKILIIEDESLVSNYMKGLLEKNDYNVIGIANNYQSTLESLVSFPDICLLDIRIANNNNGGIEIGKLLNKNKIPFIYLTANNCDFNLSEALLTKPYSFVSKPFAEREIVVTLELFRLTLENRKKIELITHLGKVLIPINDILYIQANNVYSNIFTKDKTYVMRITLKDIRSRLNYNLVKVHRSYIVNKNKITSYKSSIIYINEIKIPFSRTYRNNLN